MKTRIRPHVKLSLLLFLPAVCNGFQHNIIQTPTKRSSAGIPPKTIQTILFNSDHDYYNEEEGGDDNLTADNTKPTRRRLAGPARIRPIRISTNQKSKQAEQNRKQAQARHEQALKDPTLLTNVQFQERPDIDPASKRAITEIMGFQSMTEIQSQTYAQVLAGRSVLGRARTGTGKSLAFLLPSLERILAMDKRMYVPGKSIGVLIVAPTRELAIQLADTARILLTFHNSNDYSVLCLYGGTKMAKDIGLLNNQLPTFLIATPGRLQDHLEGTRLRGTKFSDIISETKILVLDEADRLMEGFPKEMNKIMSHLPRSDKRQTLLFSATLPQKLMRPLEQVLPEDYAIVDCVASGTTTEDKGPSARNENENTIPVRVEQSYVELDTMDQYVEALVAILLYVLEQDKEHRREGHKIIVFFPTARIVKYFAELFQVGIRNKRKIPPIFELHSRMSQSARNRISSSFRAAKQGILFTTDVSARGMDYPEISLVIQYGSPDTMEQYTHRIGRTARAGNRGRGVLVLLPFDRNILKKFQRRGIQKDDNLTQVVGDLPNDEINAILHHARELIQSGDKALFPAAEMAYTSFLAHFTARTKALNMSKKRIVDLADGFAGAVGLSEPPVLSDDLISKLKLETVVISRDSNSE